MPSADAVLTAVAEHGALLVPLALLALTYVAWWWLAHRPVYLMDLHCYQPPERLRVNHADHALRVREATGHIWTKESMDFSEALVGSSGLQGSSYISEALLRIPEDPAPITHNECLAESKMVITDIVAKLLDRTGVHPSQVDVVIVSSCCFTPTPSHAAMIVNHFKMREDVLTYNLGGMGCAASVVCADLAQHLLKSMRSKRVIMVQHENVSANLYRGQDRSMLLANCLFRIGGSAVLLSNRPQDSWKAKYHLQHLVRTHMGASDDAFGCMGSCEDVKGIPGVFLSPSVRAVAGKALQRNIKRVARLALPWWMKVKFLMDHKMPAINRAFQHFLVHTGSRGVLEGLTQRPLSISEAQLAPARKTLAKFGNTSAASTWYVLSALEQQGSIKRSDRLWQLAFGAGFKVWVARRSIQQDHECWATM